ncbi:hypothetical protein, partial [Streptomyces sioyaensis]|uniref:hypothetical protein n=1 Tax=Streptomyces sioyaensis TaxID=67364 RepID=UPI003D75CFB7
MPNTRFPPAVRLTVTAGTAVVAAAEEEPRATIVAAASSGRGVRRFAAGTPAAGVAAGLFAVVVFRVAPDACGRVVVG